MIFSRWGNFFLFRHDVISRSGSLLLHNLGFKSSKQAKTSPCKASKRRKLHRWDVNSIS